MDRRVKPGDDDLQISRPTASPFSLPFSQLQLSFLHFRAPSRGACGAPVALGCMRRTPIGRPYTLTQDARERACDRPADASSIGWPEQRARLAFVAHHRSPVAAIDMHKPASRFV